MYEEMVKCREYLDKFGGHPMAAGLSMKEERVDEFRAALNANARLTEEDLVPKVSIDVAMPLEYISERQIEELKLLEPFGKGNEKPLFAQKDLKVIGAKILGKNRNVFKMILETPGTGLRMDALYFGDVDTIDAYIRGKFGSDETEKLYLGRRNNVTLSVTYYPDINEFRGVKTLQVVVKNYM
jgi:single-stranded-DNA-specific exonuclease